MSEDEESYPEPTYSSPRVSDSPPKPPLTIKRKLVYLSLVLIVIIAGFTVVMAKLINENSQCVSNPFVYGANTIESSRGDPNALCVCVVEEGPTCMCALANNGVFWV